MSVAFIIEFYLFWEVSWNAFPYNSYRGDEDDRTWILIDGMTTFLLGGLILLN